MLAMLGGGGGGGGTILKIGDKWAGFPFWQDRELMVTSLQFEHTQLHTTVYSPMN
jgi:hypothetical protein